MVVRAIVRRRIGVLWDCGRRIALWSFAACGSQKTIHRTARSQATKFILIVPNAEVETPQWVYLCRSFNGRTWSAEGLWQRSMRWVFNTPACGSKARTKTRLHVVNSLTADLFLGRPGRKILRRALYEPIDAGPLAGLRKICRTAPEFGWLATRSSDPCARQNTDGRSPRSRPPAQCSVSSVKSVSSNP